MIYFYLYFPKILFFIIFTIYRFANSSLLSKYSIEAGTDRRRNNKNAPISKKTNNYRI